MKKLDQKG